MNLEDNEAYRIRYHLIRRQEQLTRRWNTLLESSADDAQEMADMVKSSLDELNALVRLLAEQ